MSQPPRARLRPHLDPRDLASEAIAGLFARPLRSLLTAAGTVLGIAALVATVGLSQTAGSQIVGRFNELAATQVLAEPAQATLGGRAASQLPWDVEDRLERLNGVTAAGALVDVNTGGGVSSTVVHDPGALRTQQIRVIAATHGLLAAVRGSLSSGRYFDPGFSAREDRVAVLGRGAAERLNIRGVESRPAVLLGNELFEVIGIIDRVEREPDLLNAVLIPPGAALARFGLEAPSRVVIDVEVGAARLIASQARIALVPNAPESVRVTAPGEPQRTRRSVQGDVNALFLVLGLVSLVGGAIGIANVTLVNVMERVGEIGLRRALGATRGHIAAQFLVESFATGLAGGVLGASSGVGVVTAVAIMRGWTPVLDAWVPVAAPLAGGVVGLLAGLYPALRAASLEPVEALRSGT